MAKKHNRHIQLEVLMILRGIKMADLAKTIGTTETTARKKVKGSSDFYIHEAKAICDKYGFDKSIFFDNLVTNVERREDKHEALH